MPRRFMLEYKQRHSQHNAIRSRSQSEPVGASDAQCADAVYILQYVVQSLRHSVTHKA